MSDTWTSLPPFLDTLAPDPGVPYINALFPASNDIPPVHVHWWPCKQGGHETPGTSLGHWRYFRIHTSGMTPRSRIFAPARRTSFNHALPFQIRNSLRVFDALSASFGVDTRIVIAGHSVGSWVALQVLKLRSAAVSGVFFLFPTITNIACTPNGQRLSRLFRPPFPRITSQIARVLCLVPLTILCRLFPEYPIPQAQVLRSFLLSPSSIFAAMTMAHDEMLNIRELDAATLDKYQHQICFYFAEKDDWVDRGRETILQVFRADPGTVKVVHGHRDIPHAFCINHSEELAAQCYEWLISGRFVRH
ncbi:hypothetical protein DFH29DRAFT_911989 [Suillus ampliporus]|nr:hypothetical protein DFH29DRAFT_911989 [Suillus ampliporus]